MPHPQGTIRGLNQKGAIGIGPRTIMANSTAFSFTAISAKPSSRTAGYNWSFITNSTGVSGIAIRTTGTTWKYANVTSVLPT